MKKLIGVLLIIAGVLGGVYVGFYLLFLGGIFDIIDGVKAEPTDRSLVGWGIVKAFVLPEIIGAIIFWISVLLAGYCFKRDGLSSRRSSGNRQIEFAWEQARRSNQG